MLNVTQHIGFGAGRFNDPLITVLTNLSLTTNLQMCLDAGDAASFTSGQKWLDRSGNGFDFFLGADVTETTDDPTFNGNVGGLSSSEYWSFDGGDFFRYDSGNETWMDNLHKDGAIFSMVMWLYPVLSASGRMFSTYGGAGATNGVRMYSETTGQMKFDCLKSVAFPLSAAGTAGALTANVWNFLGLSINENGGDVSFFYANGGYDQATAPDTGDTFDAAYTAPDSGAAAATMELLSNGAGTNPADSGDRCAAVAFWEGSVITKANMDDIYAQTRGRFGI